MFVWNEDYSVGVGQIDNQHKELIRIGQELAEMVDLGDGSDHFDDIVELVERLHAYTVYHFEEEEQLMKETMYDQFEEHKSEHDAFIKKLEELDLESIDRDQMGHIKEIITFVMKWVLKHILGTDKKYMVHFEKFNIA